MKKEMIGTILLITLFSYVSFWVGVYWGKDYVPPTIVQTIEPPPCICEVEVKLTSNEYTKEEPKETSEVCQNKKESGDVNVQEVVVKQKNKKEPKINGFNFALPFPLGIFMNF